MQIYTAISLLTVTLAASFTDIRTGRIPNRLCIFGLLLSLMSRTMELRWITETDFYGMTAFIILLAIAYRFRKIGGGDVKLLLVLLFLLTFKMSVQLIWLTMLFAGFAGIIGYFIWKNKYIKLGPAMFLASLVITSGGGFK